MDTILVIDGIEYIGSDTNAALMNVGGSTLEFGIQGLLLPKII